MDWVFEMREFKQWLEADSGSIERAFWVRGSAGIGKSTMAGYIIEYLKATYPSSIVAYFFCKSGEEKLENASDIVRTIAYQCSKKCESIQRMLQVLRKEQFQISSTAGINLLLKKLLKEPLSTVSEDIYIVLDGLDEADGRKLDRTDNRKRSEIEVLIEGLVGLKVARVLFISRPDVPILYETPLLLKKLISKDNIGDIETYVRHELSKTTSKVQKWYPKDKGEPIDFFVQRSNGLFLWVSSALHQLSIAKTKSKFNAYLDSLSESSGDINKLYIGILERIDDEDRNWVVEILKWIITAERPMVLNTLKEIVQWSLDDERDFEEFLEITCGSFVQITPRWDSVLLIQLSHETFRSFLYDSAKCPSYYFIDRSKIYGCITRKCVDCLSTGNASQIVIEYAADNWVHYLAKSNSTDDYVELSKQLFQLFTSVGISRWIQYGLLKSWIANYRDVDFEVDDLKLIMAWLRNMINIEELRSYDNDEKLKAAIQWSHNVLEQQILGDYIGKAATKIWLYGNLTDSTHIARAFQLGFKYYMMRGKKALTEAEEIRTLSTTQFRDLCIWSGCDCIQPVNILNFAVAFGVLKLWNQCIEAFQKQASIQCKGFKYWKELGNAFYQNGDYDSAIDLFKKAVDKFPTDYMLLFFLGNLYETVDSDNISLDLYMQTIEKSPSSSFFCAYICVGTDWMWSDGISVKIDELLVNSFIWRSVASAYKRKGEVAREIEIYNMAIQSYENALRMPGNALLWIYYGNSKYDYDFFYKKALPKIVLCSALGEAYRIKAEAERSLGNFDTAIEAIEGARVAFQTALDHEQGNVWLNQVVREFNTMQLID